jgi:acyl carrier protein
MDDFSSLESRILDILREECREPNRALHRDDQLYELLDSLGVVEVVMQVEDEFELQVPDTDMPTLKTVGDLIDYIVRHVRDRPARGQGDSAAA